MAASTNTSSVEGGFDFSSLGPTILLKFLHVLEAAIILVATYVIMRWVKSSFEKLETTHEQQKTALTFLEKITSGFIIIIGVTVSLKTVGVDMSLLVGACVLGLSYGLKDITKNYIAGILIFMKAPFKIGDIVKINKYLGKVDKMELQSTTLKTFDNKDITIYNADVMSKSIENYSRYPMRRMEFDVELGYGTDTAKTTEIFEKILKNEPGVLKRPKYRIIFKKFKDSSIIMQLKFWVKYPSDMLSIRSSIAWQLHDSIDEINILSPFGKAFESETPFVPSEKRKEKLKEFYGKSIFTAPPQDAQPAAGASVQAQPAAGAPQSAQTKGTAAGQTAQGAPAQELIPEYLDLDEPAE